MDDLADLSPLPPPAAPPRAPGAPGRPSADPVKRAHNDRAHEAKLKLLELLPQMAKEHRVHVYPAHPARDCRHPRGTVLEKILVSEWEEQGFSDVEALRAYLEEKHGPGRYFFEVRDNKHTLCTDMPQFVVETNTEPDDEQPLHRGGRMARTGRRFSGSTHPSDDVDFDDEDFETPPTQRANISDFILQANKAQTDQAQASSLAAVRSTTDVMSMMMMMQQQADARRQDAEKERQREDDRREERRREEDRIRREEQAQREEEKREERKREDERRAEAERLRMEREREQTRLMIEQANKRTELMLGAFTAVVPVLQKLFDKKEDPAMAALLQAATKKDTDPISMMVIKSMLDNKNNDSSITTMLAGLNEVSKMSSQMMSENMRSLFATTQQIQAEQTKSLMSMLKDRKGGDDDDDEEDGGGNIISQIAQIIGGASKMVDGLTKGQQPQQQQHRPGLPQPQQPQQQQPAAPHPITAVGGLMKLIQERRFQSQDEYQQILTAIQAQMPRELVEAIMANNQEGIQTLCAPHFMSEPELMTWVQQDGVGEWIAGFLNDYRGMLIHQAQQRQAAQRQQPAPKPGEGEGDGDGDEDGDDGDDADEGDDGEGEGDEDDDPV